MSPLLRVIPDAQLRAPTPAIATRFLRRNRRAGTAFFISLLAGALALSSHPAATAVPGAADPTTTVSLSSGAFLDCLDLANPALSRVRALVERKQFAAAQRALCEHFRQRRVRAGFWPPDLRSVNEPDDLVAHTFSFYGSAKFDAGDPIRWNAVFLNDRELTYALNRHQHLSILGSAYRRTRDPRYARAFVGQVRDWIARNPLSSPQSWAAWRSLEVATRIGVWSDVFFQFLAAPEFSPDDQLFMLQSLHQQAAWLAPQVEAGRGDWSTAMATGLAAVAVLFPEFKEAGLWREQAYSTLVADLQRQVYSDGSHQTLSPHHHNAALSTFWLPLKLAVENRVVVPEVYRQTLERMCAYQAYIRRPDGRYPPFNASDPMDCQPLLFAAAQFFTRPDFLYILTHGQRGTEPSQPSCAFEQSGVFIMRDNWGTEANYLALDAGPCGTSSQHEDKLAFELAAFGRTVLVDPGRYTLNLGDTLTHYLSTTAAHNTLTLDGAGQRRRQLPKSWVPTGNTANCWISRPDFDYFAGGYSDGYESAPSARHLRRVFFVKDKQRPYWVVSDRVFGEGRHQLSVRWQFAPGDLKRYGAAAFATDSTKGNLAVCPAAADALSATVLRGSRNPLGGWVSFAYGKIEPAPQLIYELRTTLPASMEHVLAPFHGQPKPPKVSAWPTSAPTSADLTSLALDFGDFRDIILVAHDLQNAERQILGCRTKGCFVVIRIAKGEQAMVLIDADAAGARPPTSEVSAPTAP